MAQRVALDIRSEAPRSWRLQSNWLLTSAIIIALIAILPVSAGAASSPYSHPKLRLTPRMGPPLTKFTAHGSRFVPGETVEIMIEGVAIETVVADGEGTFDVQLVAQSKPGVERIQALGMDIGQYATARFTVRLPTPYRPRAHREVAAIHLM